MDVDEHIDLINTLGDMLGQKDESKKDKFIDTMPTIIQMHLITEKDWAATTKKAKELEHIIRKCDPPAAALPTLAKGTAVPGLYSHIAHSNDNEQSLFLIRYGPLFVLWFAVVAFAFTFVAAVVA